jgi:hypothetical protein
MKRCWAPVASTARRNSWERNSEPLSVETACSYQPAAASSAATRRTSARGVAGGGVEGGDVDLRSGEGAGDVDGGVLPDSPLGAGETTDMEAIELDELPGHAGLQMAGSEPWRQLRLRRGGIARHQREPAPAGAQAVAAEDVVDAAQREITRPPHIGCRSCAAISRGPSPG